MVAAEEFACNHSPDGLHHKSGVPEFCAWCKEKIPEDTRGFERFCNTVCAGCRNGCNLANGHSGGHHFPAHDKL